MAVETLNYLDKSTRLESIGEVFQPKDQDRDYSKLGLLDSPITVESHQRHDGKYFSATFEKEFFKEEFMQLLDDISPVKGFADSQIIADWKMPDDPYEKDKLLKMHQRAPMLKAHWNDFELHRKKFLELIQKNGPKGYINFIKNNVEVLNYGRDEVFTKYLEKGKFDEAIADLHGWMQEDPPYHGWYQEVEEDVAMAAEKAGINLDDISRYDLMGNFYKGSTEWKRNFLANTQAHSVPFKMAVKALAEKGDYIAIRSLKNEAGNDVIMVGKERLYSGGVFVEDAETGKVVVQFLSQNGRKIPGQITNDGQIELETNVLEGEGVKPAILWKNTISGRRFVFDDPNEGTNVDSMLGFLTIPYFMPERTMRWPQQISFSKNGNGQYMRSAQVPLLALMDRRNFANSDFLKSLEQVV